MKVVVDPLGVSTDSRIVQAFMFFDRQKGGQTGKKGPSIWNPCFEIGHPNLPQAPIATVKEPILGLRWGSEDQSYQATLVEL